MSRRYGIVRVIALVLKALGIVALAAGLILAAIALLSGGDNPVLQAIKSMGAIVSLLLGVIWFVQLFAFGSILSLLVDIEENTRELAAEPTGSAVSADLA